MAVRNYSTILDDRILIRDKADKDKGFRKEVLYRCKEDTLYWHDNFAWTLDPRRTPSQLPFIPYTGKQITYLEWLEDLLKNPRDGFVDKPRDVGATAITMNFLVKHFLFDESFNARIGSRKEDYVDHYGDPDTLFYKIDYTFNRLPDWMIPEGWHKDKNRSFMRLTRPDNSNSIIGESANPNFARGGRQTIVVFDELGFWPFARSAWESAGDVTNIRLAMTTPPDIGKSSHAYKLLAQKSGKVEVFTFDYTDIPTKTPEWFAKERERRSREELEREILKSYSGTIQGKVYAADWAAYVKENDCSYDPLLPLFVAWDFGLDSVAMIWFQKDFRTQQVRIIDSYTNADKTIDFYIPFITGQIKSGLFEYTDEELEQIRLHGTWKRDITHYGDPDVLKRNLVDKRSAFQVLKEAGIYVQSKPWEGRKHRDIREKAKLLLRRLEVNQNRNEYFIECMVSARYPKESETAQSTTEKDKPIHDWTSHFRSAYEYFADNEPLVIVENKKPIQDIKKNVSLAHRPLGGYR